MVLSSSATSDRPCQRSTSRRMSTARSTGGQVLQSGDERQPDALPRASATAGRVAVGGDHPRCRGSGSPRRASEAGEPLKASVVDERADPARAGPAPLALRSMSRHTLVAIRYSHDRTGGPALEACRGSSRPGTIVSWTASSASKDAPQHPVAVAGEVTAVRLEVDRQPRLPAVSSRAFAGYPSYAGPLPGLLSYRATRRALLSALGLGRGAARVLRRRRIAADPSVRFETSPGHIAVPAVPGGCSAGETGGPYPADGTNGPNVLVESGVVRSDITSSFG